jgi:hypothetical protein
LTGSSKKSLASYHLTEAIKHLISAAEFVRELPGRDDLGLAVEGAIETIRTVRGHMEVDAPQIRARTPKKPDRREGDRRVTRRRLDDKRKIASRTKDTKR